MQTILYTYARMPWCELLIATSEHGLVAVQFVGKEGRQRETARLASHWRGAKMVESE